MANTQIDTELYYKYLKQLTRECLSDRKTRIIPEHLRTAIKSHARHLGNYIRLIELKIPISKTYLRPDIDEVIRVFTPKAKNENLHIPSQTDGCCAEASDMFLRVAEEHNMAAQVEYYDPAIYMDTLDYPYSFGTCRFHWAVRIDDWVIDWTARQFDNSAPFPAVWRGIYRSWRVNTNDTPDDVTQ